MKLLREYVKQILCIKIKSEGLEEEKDFFSGSKFSDGVKEWYVEDVLEYVQENHERYFRGDFPVSELVHNLRWWQGDEARALRADTRYPLLVLIENGEYNVCDGLNRLWKIVNVEGKDLTDIYLVPKEDIERLGFEAK
tara:strand:+ start:916 stop:1329 length:414 start_codon:yes stop_codon:yes gene_type:complete